MRTATDDVAETLRPSLITDVFALSALFRTSYAFIPANQSYKWSSILSEWFSVVSYCRYCNQTEVRFWNISTGAFRLIIITNLWIPVEHYVIQNTYCAKFPQNAFVGRTRTRTCWVRGTKRDNEGTDGGKSREVIVGRKIGSRRRWAGNEGNMGWVGIERLWHCMPLYWLGQMEVIFSVIDIQKYRMKLCCWPLLFVN